MPEPTPLPLGERPGTFLALSVADLDREAAFYRDVLGFTVHSEGAVPQRMIRFALMRQGTALIELLQFPDSKGRAANMPGTAGAPETQGLFKGGWVVDDIDTLYKSLKARGVAFWFELMQPPGGPYRAFGLKDPEGNLLQVFGT